jgi:hypothetical protein
VQPEQQISNVISWIAESTSAHAFDVFGRPPQVITKVPTGLVPHRQGPSEVAARPYDLVLRSMKHHHRQCH